MLGRSGFGDQGSGWFKVCVCVYIYIYIYVYIQTINKYINIYIYIHKMLIDTK